MIRLSFMQQQRFLLTSSTGGQVHSRTSFVWEQTGDFLHFHLYVQVFIIEGHSFLENYKTKSGVIELGYTKTIRKHTIRISVVINGGRQE